MRRHTREEKGVSRANMAVLITAAGMCTSTLCSAGTLADTTARVLAAARSSRTAHSAPSALNLRPATPAILTSARPRAFDQPWVDKSHVTESDAAESERGGLNLHVAFPIKWENTPANLNPKFVSLARNFRHSGLPIVHLWGSGRNLLALGLNPHGKPGLYFTQNMD